MDLECWEKLQFKGDQVDFWGDTEWADTLVIQFLTLLVHLSAELKLGLVDATVLC